MTPLIKIDQIYFKREDQNLTGSAKDRAISLQVEKLIKLGFKSAVISSTGNAAISAQYFCHKHKIPLTIFVSKKIDKSKLYLLDKPIFSNKPISDAIKFAKKNNAYFLRQSTDQTALIGYSQIAKEILAQLPQTSAIFVPSGSGTTALGIASNFAKVWIVQPASHCPLASHYDNLYLHETHSDTTSLGAKMLPLKSKIFKVIRHGTVIQNQDLIKAQKYLKDHDIISSAEGALALAGYFKFEDQAGNFPVIILTGAQR